MKAAKTVKPVKTVTPETPTNPEAMRILKTATCPSLSGKSKLTYQIGCTAKSDIQFRVSANSAAGFFSDEWVPLNAIQQAFDKVPSGESITSFILHPLYSGKSANTPGFLFAALKNEGLVQPAKDKQRSYERSDPKGFMAGFKALIGSADAKAESKPQKADSKPIATLKKTPSKSSARKKV
jgi:hypothetical protein